MLKAEEAREIANQKLSIEDVKINKILSKIEKKIFKACKKGRYELEYDTTFISMETANYIANLLIDMGYNAYTCYYFMSKIIIRW